MPRKTKTTAVADKAAQPQFSAELLEQLIPGPVTPAELEGIFQQFKKSVLERALGAEMNRPGFCRQLRASYFLSNRSPYEQSTLPRRIQDRGGQTNP